MREAAISRVTQPQAHFPCPVRQRQPLPLCVTVCGEWGWGTVFLALKL